jgi:hypothetical protein
MPTITVSVTKRDISRGRRCSSSTCPVAWALNRRTAKKWDVACGRCLLFATAHWSAPMPEVVKDFVDAFDNGKPVKPFRFRLDVPARFLKGSE